MRYHAAVPAPVSTDHFRGKGSVVGNNALEAGRNKQGDHHQSKGLKQKQERALVTRGRRLDQHSNPLRAGRRFAPPPAPRALSARVETTERATPRAAVPDDFGARSSRSPRPPPRRETCFLPAERAASRRFYIADDPPSSRRFFIADDPSPERPPSASWDARGPEHHLLWVAPERAAPRAPPIRAGAREARTRPFCGTHA